MERLIFAGEPSGVGGDGTGYSIARAMGRDLQFCCGGGRGGSSRWEYLGCTRRSVVKVRSFP